MAIYIMNQELCSKISRLHNSFKELNKWYQSMPTGQNRHAHTPQQPMYQREYLSAEIYFIYILFHLVILTPRIS